MGDILNTMTAVAVELKRRGIKARVEYPGFVNIEVRDRGVTFAWGVANGHWQGDVSAWLKPSVILETLESSIPAHSDDVQRIANHIACAYVDACGPIAPLQIPTAESEACSCGRGEGRHHPDCPAWDSHTDNYQEAL